MKKLMATYNENGKSLSGEVIQYSEDSCCLVKFPVDESQPQDVDNENIYYIDKDLLAFYNDLGGEA